MGISRERELAVGARIAGRYRIEGAVARGGMGAVYVALDESSGTRVALKRRGGKTPRSARMFEREYHTLRGLQHPHIIDVYDYGVEGDGAYYTMELLDGQDLRELAPLPYRRACRYLRDVASGLALLHARRLLHRDLSPGNVRVLGDGRCKLIDFGVLTSFGIAEVLAGTPPMVPPEALGGAPLDQRADLFSLGALAYWLLTGKHAFPAKSLEELRGLWRSAPAAPSKRRGATSGAPDDEPIPPSLDALVLSLLDGNPVARPSSAAELIDRLTVVAELEPFAEPLAAESYLASAPTVGREREQARLTERLDSALGGIGSSLIVEAEPGLGSSQLLAAVALSAQLRGAMPVVVDAKLRRGNYGAVQDLIHTLLEAAPELALQTSRADAGALAQVSAELGARLGVEPLRVSALAPGELRMRVQLALSHWLWELAGHRTLLIAVDNAQDLDEASATLLATLARQVRDHPMMLVSVLKRDGPSVASPVLDGLLDASATMELVPLNREQVQALLTGVFGPVPHLGRLAEQAYRATAGRPLACVELVRHLVRSDVIRHADGVWTLPREIDPSELPTAADPHARLLTRLSDGGRRLAQALSVHVGSLPLELCLAVGDGEGIADVWSTLEELTVEGVLGRSESDYHFVHDSLRTRLLAGIDDTRRRALHRLMGDQFALGSRGDTDTMLDAGFHLLQGGEEGRGADLLALAGLRLGYDSDEMGAAVRPLRAALQVFREQQRPDHEIAKLLGPLCNAAWYCDRTLADEFGEEGVSMLADQIGLTRAARLRPFLGKRLSLFAGLGSAAFTFLFRRGRGGIQALREMIVMYFSAVLSLAGVAAISLDAERATALIARIEHLTALGKDHAASVSHRMAELLALAPQDYGADAIAGCRALIERVESDKPVRDLPPDLRLMVLGGLRYELGAFESFCGGPAAHEAADALESTGLQLYRTVAAQVRANYHACRGEIELADLYRDRVEMHAVQAGSAWQSDVWAPASAILASVATRDLIGMKRSHEELERLSMEIPSLQRHAQVAQGGVLWMRGELRQAARVWQQVLDDSAPRSFVGWSATRAMLARTHNELGEHARAKALCEETLSLLSPADLELTAMCLSLDAELSVARAHLGEPAAALQRMEALLEVHREHGGPVALGTLHEACVRIAIHSGDLDLALQHVSELEACYGPTRNPALLQQCVTLRTRITALRRGASDPTDVLTSPGAAAQGALEVTLAGPAGISDLDLLDGDECIERALSLIVSETGSVSGLMFAVVRQGLSLLAPDPEATPPEHVLDQVMRDIRAFERARRRTSTELARDRVTATMTVTTTAIVSPAHGLGAVLERPRDHDYSTVILSPDGARALGAVVVWVGPHPRPVDDLLVRAITESLIKVGALGDPRTTKPLRRAGG